VTDRNVERTGNEPLSEEERDDLLFQQCQDILSGETARRWAIDHARQDQIEREAEWLNCYRTSGSPLRRDHEHLRHQLPDHGY
jgi:hypothetical protein